MKKLGLLPRILIAIVLGIAIGYISPMWFARIMATFNTIFSQFLGFMIPMIIVGFVAPAIADIGGRAGKLLVVTAAIAYIATFFAGILSYLTGTLSFPSLIGGEQGMALLGDTSKVLPFFNIEMPPLMTVMTALVFAFMFGLGMAFVKGTALRKGFDELRDIVSKTIDTAILLYLRNFPEHDFGRAGWNDTEMLHKDYSYHLYTSCIHSYLAILHRITVRTQKPVFNVADNASGILHSTRDTIVGCNNTGNAATGHQNGSKRRHRRIRNSAMRHYPHERQHSKNSRMRPRAYDHARPAT